jgi:hypothetical protein
LPVPARDNDRFDYSASLNPLQAPACGTAEFLIASE